MSRIALLLVLLMNALFSHEKYKNIIFDLGQVMLEWNPAKMIEEVFKAGERVPYEFMQVFGSPLWLEYDAGLSRKELIEKLPANLDKDLFARLESRISQCLLLIPEMIAIVDEVKQQGYNVYILSNMPKPIFQELDESHGLSQLFHGQTISSDVGAIKPFPKIYQSLLSAYSLKSEECLFIDDREENIRGGEACGIDGIVHLDSHQLRNELERRAVLPTKPNDPISPDRNFTAELY